MDFLLPEAEAFYIMDRAYLDFERLHRLHLCGIFFVSRNKSNTKTYRLKYNPVDRSTDVICDQFVKLSGISSKARFPEQMRRIKYRDPETGKVFVFLTNNISLSPTTIAALYKSRWKIELFFK